MPKTKKKASTRVRAEEYSYRVQYDPQDGDYLGLVDEFPGLSAFVDSPEAALREIQTVVREGIALLNERKQSTPPPLSRRTYTGKVNLRLPVELHRQLELEATRQGVSLNQLITLKLKYESPS